MLITIPASADGTSGPTSVLDLEPLVGVARECRAGAIRLLPPIGADDLPNGAALLAMKQRLERANLGVVPGFWRAPADADVADPAWQTANLFEARSLLAALGEADVQPLTLLWEAPVRDAGERAALRAFLQRLLEEAERAQVRVALQADLAGRAWGELLRNCGSRYFGACWTPEGGSDPVRTVDLLGEKLFAALMRLDAGTDEHRTARALRTLAGSGFQGPAHVVGPSTAAGYAHAVGWMRGVLLPR